MADSVGRIYVDVIADTSGMKEQIRKAGVRAGKGGAKAFTESFQKQVDKDTKKMQFDRLAKKFTDDMTRDIARKIKQNAEKGIHSVDMGEFSKKWAIEMSRIAKLTGHTQVDMAKAWDEHYVPSMRRAFDEMEKEEKKSFNMRNQHAQELADISMETNRKLAAFDAKLRDKRQAEVLRDLDVTMRRVERDIEKEHKLRTTMHKEVHRSQLGFLDRMAFSLRRMGTGGAFDTMTNLLGGLVKLGPMAGRVVTKAFTSIGGAFTKLGGTMAKMGGRLGRLGGSFAKLGGSLGKLAGPIGTVVSAFVSLNVIQLVAKGIMALAPLVKNLAGILTLVASAAGNAVLAMVPMVNILISLGAAIGVAAWAGKDAAGAFKALFKASSSGDPKDWEAYAEAIGKLGGNAKKAVEAFKPMLSSLKDLRKEAEQKMFEGMAESIKKFAPVVDAIKGSVDDIATAIGNVGDKFFRLGDESTRTGQVFVNSVKTIMDSMAPIIENVGNAMVNIFAGLTNFFAALSPLAIEISEEIEGIGYKFLKWTESDANRQKILDFFRGAWEVAKDVGNIIWTLGGIMMSVFGASQDPLSKNEGFLDRINDKLDEWLAWTQTEEGKKTIQIWLDRAARFASGIASAVGAIVRKFEEWDTPENRKFLRDTVTSLENIVTTAMDIVIWIDRIITWIKLLGKSLANPFSLLINLSIKKPEWLAGPMTWLNNLLPGSEKIKTKAAGGLITSPTRVLAGEAGPEAIIPLARPLSQIDPSVRAMAALLRGQDKGKTSTAVAATIGTTMSNTFNITTPAEDPRAVAAQVVNRLAASAR